MSNHDVTTLPYRIAVLCYLYDDQDQLLMLHRAKSPNLGMYSPIGGKVEVSEGESPHDGAVREISEEVKLDIPRDLLHLTGIVSEKAYENEHHWLIFIYEVMRPIAHDEIVDMTFNEGSLEWVKIDDIEKLDIPETDRKILWPLVNEHRGGFFMVHIDCSVEPMQWDVRESHKRISH
ncbi:MAG: NUDIX domain-containing protein [Planctomycetota bacterium]|nr:NUDIX domain-containing protein [Planctomycetota bacterium]